MFLKEEIDIKISRLNSLVENCRLDLAQPFSIGVVRTIDKMFNKGDVSQNEYNSYNKKVNDAINKANRCVCQHPLSQYA